MNIYLLELTPLTHVSKFSTPPQSGDVVAFMRAGQDPTGREVRALEKQGIRVISTANYLCMDDGRAIQKAGDQFTSGWFLSPDGADTSIYQGISIGELVAIEIMFQACPAMIYRTGELCRKLMEEFQEAVGFFSDLTDNISYPTPVPLGSTVHEVVGQAGLSYTWLNPVDPLPPAFPLNKKLNCPRSMARQFLGGLRPKYFWGRFKLRIKRFLGAPGKPIYIFMGHGAEKLARKFSADKNFQVIVNQIGLPGTDALRHDHLLALPDLTSLHLCWEMLRRLQEMAGHPCDRDGRFAFRGIDYGPMLARTVKSKLRLSLPLYMVVFAQIMKLQKIGRFMGVVTNGEGMTGMRILSRLQHDTNVPVYLSRHGINIHRSMAWGIGFNSLHVTYIACGEDHKNEYDNHLHGVNKPRVEVIGSPMTSIMAPLRDRRPEKHQKRLLIIGYGSSMHNVSARAHICDRYTMDAFECARQLVDEGWSVRYRTHPGFSTKFEERLIDEMGIIGKISFDKSASFEDALLECDVVIGTLSSTFYQALYAGWPIVFHDPLYDTNDPNEFLDEFYTGVIAAKDIDRPITRDAGALLNAVRSSLEPDSLVSRFPEHFVKIHKKRFIGEDPENSEKHIMDFIAQDLISRWSSPEERRS